MSNVVENLANGPKSYDLGAHTKISQVWYRLAKFLKNYVLIGFNIIKFIKYKSF